MTVLDQGKGRARQLVVVIGASGAAEVAWSAAGAAVLPGLPALYRLDAEAGEGIMRPIDAPAGLVADPAPAPGSVVAPEGFTVTIAPASAPWQAGPVLHRVTYSWSGTLPYDTYEWPDEVPVSFAEAVERCCLLVRRARCLATRRLVEPGARRRAEAWGENVLLHQLDPWQRAQYEAEQRFLVQAPSGRHYLITRQRCGNVYALDGLGRSTAAWSLLPAVPVSLAHQLGQQAWLLAHDEERFLRFALAAQFEEGGERVP
ncbi:MAG TPA: hypothetical protein VF995_04170 [Actinomycetota bacterium]